MTTNKDFKRLVRARMSKTGEAYTTARAHILTKSRNTSKPAASKSKTYMVRVTTMFEAWAESRRRKQWLNEPSVTLRTAIRPKSIRLGWRGGTIVAIWFTPKGQDKTAVAIAHTKLTSKADADRMKQYWSERLDALGKWLSRSPRGRRSRSAVKPETAAALGAPL